MSSSPLLSSVWMFSFSKNTPIPFSLSLRTVVRVSTVFRAKRETDFVMIRSILPSRRHPRRDFARLAAADKYGQ